MPTNPTTTRQFMFLFVGAIIILAGAGCPKKESGVADTAPVMEKDTEAMKGQLGMMDDAVAPSDESSTMMKESVTPLEGQMMIENGGLVPVETAPIPQPGVYQVYTPGDASYAKQGNVVLFFKADWCPTCRTVDADILKHLAEIPPNTHILKVDYEKPGDLKKKYGVTYQHTFVQIDEHGEMITKWSGGNTLASVLSHIQ